MVFFLCSAVRSGLSPFTIEARATRRLVGVIFRGHHVSLALVESGLVRARDGTAAQKTDLKAAVPPSHYSERHDVRTSGGG